jgi:hypothetical protein
MIKQVKIGPFEFPNSWVSHRVRMRLSAGIVNRSGYFPVITMENKRSLCKVPEEFAGSHVGALNTSSTNVFDLRSGKLLCHVFDPTFLPEAEGPYTEPKQITRGFAFVLGERPHVLDMTHQTELSLDQFGALHPRSYFLDAPDHARRIEVIKRLFGFGYSFRNRDLSLDGAKHKKTGTIKQITTLSFRKALEKIKPHLAPELFSSCSFLFSFDGSLVSSKWGLNIGEKTVEWKTSSFPFTWEELGEAEDV